MSKQTECKGWALANGACQHPHIAQLCTQGGSALGCERKSACPIEVKWHPGVKGVPSAALITAGSVLRALLLLRLHLPCFSFQLSSLPQTTALMAASSPWITTPQQLQMPRMSSTPFSTIVLVWILPPCIPQLGKNRGFPFLTHHCWHPTCISERRQKHTGAEADQLFWHSST